MSERVISQSNNIRLVETYGRYCERRYEIQEKYHYVSHGKMVSDWKLRAYSHDISCAMKLYRWTPQEIDHITKNIDGFKLFNDIEEVW